MLRNSNENTAQFTINDLPVEILLQVINEVSSQSLGQLLSANQYLSQLVRDDAVWKKLGFNSLSHFKTFPKCFQQAILKGDFSFPQYETFLKEIEKPDDVLESMLKENKLSINLNVKRTEYLNSLGAPFIKQYPAYAFSAPLNYLNIMSWSCVKKFLRQGVFTIDEALQTPFERLDELMRSGEHLFKFQLFSYSDAVAMGQERLNIFTTSEMSGILEENLLTKEQVLSLDDDKLSFLISLEGKQLLKAKLLSFEPVKEMKASELKNFIDDLAKQHKLDKYNMGCYWSFLSHKKVPLLKSGKIFKCDLIPKRSLYSKPGRIPNYVTHHVSDESKINLHTLLDSNTMANPHVGSANILENSNNTNNDALLNEDDFYDIGSNNNSSDSVTENFGPMPPLDDEYLKSELNEKDYYNFESNNNNRYGFFAIPSDPITIDDFENPNPETDDKQPETIAMRKE